MESYSLYSDYDNSSIGHIITDATASDHDSPASGSGPAVTMLPAPALALAQPTLLIPAQPAATTPVQDPPSTSSDPTALAPADEEESDSIPPADKKDSDSIPPADKKDSDSPVASPFVTDGPPIAPIDERLPSSATSSLGPKPSQSVSRCFCCCESVSERKATAFQSNNWSSLVSYQPTTIDNDGVQLMALRVPPRICNACHLSIWYVYCCVILAV